MEIFSELIGILKFAFSSKKTDFSSLGWVLYPNEMEKWAKKEEE